MCIRDSGYIESTIHSSKRREQDEWDNESSQLDEFICYKMCIRDRDRNERICEILEDLCRMQGMR